jgi:hypothetical protein
LKNFKTVDTLKSMLEKQLDWFPHF